MARSLFTSTPTINLNQDDGLVRIAMTQSEVHNIPVALTGSGNAFADLTGFVITATARRAVTNASGGVTGLASTAPEIDLPIIGRGANNRFRFVVDAAAVAGTSDATVGEPLYYILEVTVNDGAATNPQEWSVVRAVLELLYSPSA